LSGALAVHAGDLVAGMVMRSRVWGLTPFRSLRSRTSNVPKPVSVTFSPRVSASVMRSSELFYHIGTPVSPHREQMLT
jgi:hypothetical protein